MRIKIYKRSVVVRNVIFFLMLSLVFFYIELSFQQGLSAFSLVQLKKFFLNESLLCLSAIVSGFFIFKVKKNSSFIFLFFTFFIFIRGIGLYVENLDKTLLLLNFLYLVFSYYLLIFWLIELKDATFCPFFDNSLIDPSSIFKVKVKCSFNNGPDLSARLTNWDQEGCFILFDQKKIPHIKNVLLSFSFAGTEFNNSGRIVSRYKNGIGIKLYTNDRRRRSRSKMGWIDFFNIAEDRGFHPIQY